MSEQKILILEQTTQKVNGEHKEEDSPESRDREIQLLHQQISSLQTFLADLSHEYK
jgi:hypothetical protein